MQGTYTEQTYLKIKAQAISVYNQKLILFKNFLKVAYYAKIHNNCF